MLHAQCSINSLWPSDAIWRYKSVTTLVQVMVCCLTAQTHYLNQCWLLICEVLWHSCESNFTVSTQTTFLYDEFEKYTFKTTSTSPRGQGVKFWWDILYCNSLQVLGWGKCSSWPRVLSVWHLCWYYTSWGCSISVILTWPAADVAVNKINI